MASKDTEDNLPTAKKADAGSHSTAGNAKSDTNTAEQTAGQSAPKKRRKRKIKVQESPKQLKSPKKIAADARKVKEEYVASPPWVPYLGTGLIVAGIAVIVLNYLVSGLPPLYNNWIFVGFGGMVVGLAVLSRWK